MEISLIIPTYNESGHIGRLLHFLRTQCTHPSLTEIIVADGNSTDTTVAEARKAGARVIVSPQKGRAAQMNAGAEAAKGNILYFLHCDTFPPAHFASDILRAVEKGYGCGCYRLAFDQKHWFLALNCWFTRFDVNAFRFGDQSLFVRRDAFFQAGGFRNELIVMEDQEIIGRLRKHSRFKILDNAVITSARKYLTNGIYKTQGVFFLIYFLYKLGLPQDSLVNTYRRLFDQDKV
jgi:rSAM/selenodomain-associated transferase 2